MKMTAKGQRLGEAICFCTKKGNVCLSEGGPARCSPPILPPGLHRITPMPRTHSLAVGCQSQLLNFQKLFSSLTLAMAEVFALQNSANATNWGSSPCSSDCPLACAPLILTGRCWGVAWRRSFCSSESSTLMSENREQQRMIATFSHNPQWIRKCLLADLLWYLPPANVSSTEPGAKPC